MRPGIKYHTRCVAKYTPNPLLSSLSINQLANGHNCSIWEIIAILAWCYKPGDKSWMMKEKISAHCNIKEENPQLNHIFERWKSHKWRNEKQRYWLSCLGPLVTLLPKNYLSLNMPDEGYSRSASYSQNLIDILYIKYTCLRQRWNGAISPM